MRQAYSKKIKDFFHVEQAVFNASLFMYVSDAHLHMYLISQRIYAKNAMDTARLANNLSVCFSCYDGFYYDIISSRCLQCHSNCLTCLGKTPDRCMNCIDGFFYSNGS